MNNGLEHRGKSNRWVRRINRLMLAVIVGLAGYVMTKYFSDDPKIENSFAENVRQERETSAEKALVFETKPLSVYVNGINERDMFMPADDPSDTENTMLPVVIPALENKIKLIGILVDRDSKAIVEDLQNKQTHFLSRGDSIGTVLLEEIREDKVIFMYNNERFELSL